MVLKLKNTIVIPCITLLLLFLSTLQSSSSSQEQQQTFIVHVSKPHKPTIFTTHHHWYTSTLSSLPPSHHPTKILYTYDHTLHGFSARLTPSQAAALQKVPGIKKIVPERVRHVHTTRSPDFLGLNHVSGLWPNTDYADDIVIGVFDTGIWPERRSFSDDSLLSVPTKFKGTCDISKDFPVSSCNKKLVGARFFLAGYEARYGPINETLESRSPRDTEGHGTHTASTAAGSSVKDASFYGYAVGEARGVAAKARLAVYKICWKEGCFDADILGALDQAIDDGVDVISISLGIDTGLDYDDDSFSIGAFGAVEKGVIVSSAAGNSGPKESTIENIAPWVLTIGASTIDRSFPADAVLGDGRIYRGVSLYSGEPLDPTVYLPLVYAGDHGHRLCVPNTLTADVKGKIVLCDRGFSSNVEKGSAVKLAGGAGMILASTVSTGSSASADVHVIPTTMVDPTAGDKIRNYIKSNKSPTAKIIPHGTVIGPTPSSPRVASFSSRGPNQITPEIIKPDVIAPGVNILASWTGARSPSGLDSDLRRVEFSFQSGTSMACPHVSGVAALLRRAHPKWSPAAVKSAIMTTAYQLDNTANKFKDISTGKESTPFDHGSGHVDPNRAVDPGLIYDLTTTDYIGFLCSIGYEEDRIGIIVKDRTIDCSTMGLDNPGNLNYPSFSVIFKSSDGVVRYRRAVTNVGESVDAVYEVKVSSPAAVDVVVLPSKLVFSAQNQTLLYEVKFSSLEVGESAKFGLIEWSDGAHVVRSPIAFTWGEEEEYVSSI